MCVHGNTLILQRWGRVSNKVSTVDAAGGERVGLSGLLVRHTPMLLVIALESVHAMCV